MPKPANPVGRPSDANHGGAPRKLPDDATLRDLLASGEFYAAIARRFAVTDDAVRKHARRLGFDPIAPGARQGHREHSRVDWQRAAA